MKTFSLIALLVLTASAQKQATNTGCPTCARIEPAVPPAVASELEALPKGRIENLIPIGMLISLGCENCAEKAVQWALAQGSSREDVDAALRTIAVVQKLDCFNQQFGSDVASRLGKPLEAARRALEQATSGGKSPKPL